MILSQKFIFDNKTRKPWKPDNLPLDVLGAKMISGDEAGNLFDSGDNNGIIYDNGQTSNLECQYIQ